MAISDYSTTAGSNTAISGINIAEGCSPGTINNAIRQLMADLKAFYDTVSAGGDGSYQPLDATLTAIAALAFTANKFMYATGTDTFALSDITAFGRSLIAASNAADARTVMGAAPGTSISGTASSGSKDLGGGFAMTWKRVTYSGSGSFNESFGGGYSYTSWAQGWVEGDDGIEGVSIVVGSCSTSAWIGSRAFSGSHTVTLFSIGV